MRGFRLALVLAPLAVVLSARAALADIWVFLVQPAPYSNNPPPYSSWQPYQQFDNLEDCLDQAMTLHYQYWESNRDLSMRELNGVCRNESTGQIVTGGGDDAK